MEPVGHRNLQREKTAEAGRQATVNQLILSCKWTKLYSRSFCHTEKKKKKKNPQGSSLPNQGAKLINFVATLQKVRGGGKQAVACIDSNPISQNNRDNKAGITGLNKSNLITALLRGHRALKVCKINLGRRQRSSGRANLSGLRVFILT